MDEANIYDIAASLGLLVGKGVGPCPWCGAETRSTAHHKDKRLPIGVTRDGCGWLCHVCGEKGGRKKLREKLGAEENTQIVKRVPLQQTRYLSVEELSQLQVLPISKATVVDAATKRQEAVLVSRWLRRRMLPADGAGVVFARDLSARSKIAEKIRHEYLAVAHMFDSHGYVLGVKYRSIYDNCRIKELSPAGRMCSGLAFASPQTVARLRRTETHESGTMIVAEGLPDTIVLAARYGHAADVIGVVSGSINSHWGDVLSRYKVIVIATHNDHAGDDYADRVARACVEASRRNGRTVPALLRFCYRGHNDANDMLIASTKGGNKNFNPTIDLYSDYYSG